MLKENIDLKVKVTGSTLHRLIERHWENSFKSKFASFDLRKLEWISNSELTFIISWIESLESNDINIQILLQSDDDILSTDPTYSRRRICLNKILLQWQLRKHISAKTELVDGGIALNSKSSNSIASFTPIPISVYNTDTFDKDFDDLFNKYLKEFYYGLNNALKDTSVSYFDKKFLNYSIIKELYSNVCLHANSVKSSKCYFSIGVNKKYNQSFSGISAERVKELSQLEKDFFTIGDNYRNIDYVEINFHDLGDGIANSLSKKYKKETESDLKTYFGDRYDLHKIQSMACRTLEYSFLLFSSQFEIEKKFEVHDYIPRGLFILKEIVQKYQGYIEIISNDGAIGLSYKDGSETVNYSKSDNKKVLFPGTRIKIVFPAEEVVAIKKTIGKFSYEKKLDDAKYVGIQFLKIFTETEFSLKAKGNTNENQYRIGLTSQVFKKLLDTFRQAKLKEIILIDFSGVELKTVDFFNKFIYFITHCRFDSNKIILFNINQKELNSTAIFDIKLDLKSKGFFPYPIPAINVDLSVEWLGINDKSVEAGFTQLWIGNDNVEFSNENLDQYSTGLVTIKKKDNAFKISVNLPLLYDIQQFIATCIKDSIESEINGNGIRYFDLYENEEKDYNRVVIRKPNTVFLASNGTYLSEYISFNEKLHILSYRRMIACYFIFCLFNKRDEREVLSLNKILSVTLSSQLIGNEVKEILNAIDERINVELIALSNYYNFQNEERFNDIKRNNNVIIVSDVISTGSLTHNLIKAVEKQNAKPVACISIINLGNNDVAFKKNVPIISLAESSVKIVDGLKVGTLIEWINPVLNVPVSMPKSKSKENVLFEKEDFLEFIDEEYLIIGNLKNESVYFNYFLQTSELLKNDLKNNFFLLKNLFSRLKDKKKKQQINEIDLIQKGISIISKSGVNPRLKEQLETLNKIVSKISKKHESELFNEYNADLVFYPFLSDINIIEDDIRPFIDSALNTNSPVIFPIPRIMTPRGWRFSFPPKFLNIVTSRKSMSALIIDDGSCTGATIMQMIDSISFLSLKSIDVLSIFGRLEDFQKELFSRIKSIDIKESVVPINIYFGTHFNIPIHNSSESPFHLELREIKELEKHLNQYISPEFERYLNERKEFVSNIQYPKVQYGKSYIDPAVSRKKLFELRDFLGRYDSYRLFSDDIPLSNINNLISDRDAIYRLLIVLNLEPNLYHTVKRIFPKEKIAELREFIITHFLRDSSFFIGIKNQEFVIKSLFYIDEYKFIDVKFLSHLCEILFANYVKESFNYLKYILLLVQFEIKSVNANTTIKFINVIIDFENQLHGTNIFSEFRGLFLTIKKVQKERTKDGQLPINQFHNVRIYYEDLRIAKPSHVEAMMSIKFDLIRGSLNSLIKSIEENRDKGIIENDFQLLLENFKRVSTDFIDDFIFKFIQNIVAELLKNPLIKVAINLRELEKVISDCYILFEKKSLTCDIINLSAYKNILERYSNLVLSEESPFSKFILDNETDLIRLWNSVETFYANSSKGYQVAKQTIVGNDFIVNVHPFAMQLAFENIIGNKIRHAEDATWEIEFQHYENEVELTFTQSSKFEPTKGDGIGLSNIRGILWLYSATYTRVSTEPRYIFKISITKDKSNESTEYTI